MRNRKEPYSGNCRAFSYLFYIIPYICGRIDSMKKRVLLGIITIIFISVLVAVCYCYVTQKNVDKKLQEESRQKVEAYHQEVDENGIAVDMRDNPVFAEELPGFEYPAYTTISYYSKVTDTIRHANVILPIGYDETKSYPVLYLLHGLGGSHKTWINKKADVIIQNLIYFQDVEPMILVLPNSELNEIENTDALAWYEKAKYYDKTEEDLTECLMPYIEKHYSVKEGRKNRAIAGNSMGGRNTMNTAFKHPELFGYVGVFSSANVFESGGKSGFSGLLSDEDFAGKEFELFLLMVGKQDDVCGWVTPVIHEKLEKNGIDHVYYEVEGGHNTYVWQNALYNFVLRIFK